MNIDDIKTIAVIGAGDMGHGIAEVALIAGYQVMLQDITQEFVNRGVKRIYDSLEKMVSKNKVTQEHFDTIKSKLLTTFVEVEDAVRSADLVIEAVPELMELKKTVFTKMDKAAPAHTILASNTSTMKISDIASITNRPEKVVGIHYFNPAVLMKLVEVIKGDKTSEETMQIGVDFVKRTAKVPVRVEKDVAGFIVNRVQAPAGVLLSAILDEGEIDPESIDALLRSLGMPMGPYETMDYSGLDISCHGGTYYAETIHPDFTPGKTIADKVKNGDLGKKSGKGIFDWSAGRPNIDLSKATDKFDPMDLIAVNTNEATKIIADGACSLEDIDVAIINATGNPMGLIGMVKGMEPEDLTKRLDGLAERFDKEIFKPTQMIKDGQYR
jgi:enoyl-CoA hydratase / 3-hydroxyacyl-CoA dehydrogenase